MDTDMAAYKDDFLQELYECLDIYNQSFVDLENGDNAAVNEIFRVTHTIKGMAGFLRYTSLETLCHSMEEVLGSIKNGDIEIDSDLIDIMLSAVDRISEMVKKIESEDNDNVKIEDLMQAFDTYKITEENKRDSSSNQKPTVSKTGPTQEALKQPSKNEISSEPELNNDQQTESVPSQDDYLILDVDLAADCVVKSLRASLVIESLRDICKVSKTVPDEDEMEGNFNGHFTVFLSGDRDEVEELMDRIPEIEKFTITNDEKPEKSQLDEVQVLKENLVEPTNQDLNPQERVKTGKLEFNSSSSPPETENSKSSSSDTKRNETIRVSIANLDNIMNLVGELVINKGRLLQIAQHHNIPELNEATGTLDKSISSLQNEVMRTRMVKIERVFSKFPRMVRDLSRKLDKNIDFAIEGEDTELDRTILDEISDPLVHLVRNAVDHGVESPQERLQNGKNATGQILLSARREKNNGILFKLSGMLLLSTQFFL